MKLLVKASNFKWYRVNLHDLNLRNSDLGAMFRMSTVSEQEIAVWMGFPKKNFRYR